MIKPKVRLCKKSLGEAYECAMNTHASSSAFVDSAVPSSLGDIVSMLDNRRTTPEQVASALWYRVMFLPGDRLMQNSIARAKHITARVTDWRRSQEESSDDIWVSIVTGDSLQDE